MTQERWEPVAGFEGLYEVSTFGRVRSLRFDRIMSPGSGRDDYPIVSFYGPSGRRSIAIHRLVAETFVPGKSALHNEAAHLDGNKFNARADNLKWCSKVENHSHKRLHGTHQAGEQHPRAKLSAEEVRRIRTRYANSRQIAEDYGISRHTVFDIWQSKSWVEDAKTPRHPSPNRG